MAESGFVPLSPRRLHPIVDLESSASRAASNDVARADEATLEQVAIPGEADIVLIAASTGAEGDLREQPDIDSPDVDVATMCFDVASDAARIRVAAIHLAAAACARALRYALDRNPRLLARFVDDALRAAGSPEHATVRLAPSAATQCGDSSAYDVVADESHLPGDVFIECADGTLGATIDQRAEGLVRSVSS